MIIGIPKEIKIHEYRIGATPAMVKILVQAGHKVYVQSLAGERIGFTDQLFALAGAEIVKTAAEVYQCNMIIKVKELQLSEFPLLHEGQVLFCFLHLAPDPIQTEHLLKSKVIAIGYETVTDSQNKLPLLHPMSEIAGRIAIQAGATALQLNYGGKGLLLGGVPGVAPANVAIIGGGAAGTEAARMAIGLGANVTILDTDIHRLRYLNALYGPNMKTLYSTSQSIEDVVINADLVIGAVLVPGKTTPKLVTSQMVHKMNSGSVIVDVSIDQGGCVETAKPTTHADPTYVIDGIVHYCVTNMPGACARTSTLALTNATLEYALALANKGVTQALKDDSGLRKGLNVYFDMITHPAVAHDLGYSYHSPESVLTTKT